MFEFLATVFPLASQEVYSSCQLFSGPSLFIVAFQSRKLNSTLCMDLPVKVCDHNPSLRMDSDSCTGLQMKVRGLSLWCRQCLFILLYDHLTSHIHNSTIKYAKFTVYQIKMIKND
ncbi:UNVERIFIED_CONTAM: hypothetical protein K2H54_041160 [Gekko kuhli]